ncbi:MAG: hypothetical protein AUK35_04870 [Zetaproteobacteria bacterium CG2_30_46_52]|nr:MAG: hypothetical protein AUK35_04870 [Zetaproteobacteria bacterium CG2_30_46_52]
MDQFNLQRLKILLLFRALASLSLFAILFWMNNVVNFSSTILLTQVSVFWLAFTAIQVLGMRLVNSYSINLLVQFTSDLILICFLIYGSGGLESPFIFLLGLVIVVAGSQSRVLVVLTVAVLASIAYLTAIYTYANVHDFEIIKENVLRILLQTSVFFLAGGMMAHIASKHAALQKESEQAITKHKNLKELYAQVLSTMEEGIIILNQSMQIQDFNAAAANIIGISNHQKGFSIKSFIQLSPSFIQHLQMYAEGTYQTEHQHQNLTLLLRLNRIMGEETSWLLTIIDITENRKLAQQLAERDKLASIGQMAAMLAHEIRNPMQTVAQAVELMGLKSEDKKLENIITHEISRLNRLVSDMLDYANPLHPHLLQSHIQTLIHQSVEQQDLSNKHKIIVTCEDVNIEVDPDHFRLVLDNLLRNAIFSSPEPASIKISFNLINDVWQLIVRDHGKGIAPQLRNNMFEPFRTGSKQGTGLGLATVWQVCHINHWDISIDNDIDDGACFIVRGNANIAMRG